MSILPEELNEQCSECQQWGGILWRAEMWKLPFRLCHPCFEKYMAMSPDAASKYRVSLYHKLFLEYGPLEKCHEC